MSQRLGDAFLADKQYKEASKCFSIVLQQVEQGIKQAPKEAQLVIERQNLSVKISKCLYGLGDKENSFAVLVVRTIDTTLIFFKRAYSKRIKTTLMD